MVHGSAEVLSSVSKHKKNVMHFIRKNVHKMYMYRMCIRCLIQVWVRALLVASSMLLKQQYMLSKVFLLHNTH
jgi:hypothetical protein